MSERRLIKIGGTVQGVGFRPFVNGLASRYNLYGFIRNSLGGVQIEVEGETDNLEQFLDELVSHPPSLAQIDSVSCDQLALVGSREFRIEASECDGAGQVAISPDVTTCRECLAELFDATDHRYQYPFLNCTNCGPRLTIVTGSPYDRERTTMANFLMCKRCRKEYEDPTNRRFHAQPTACPECGPRLCLAGPSGDRIESDDPLSFFAQALRAGRTGAMKGIGGYHLVCDARNELAVKQLRRRKHRDEKPFAIMVKDLESAEAFCHINRRERELLLSWRSPIVLLRKRECNENVVADAVAPGLSFLGVMLPYTPLHHLLLQKVNGIPLVMTSGNQSDEPIAYREDDAVERLQEIADLFLFHNRPIHIRCDDSVTRIVSGAELPIRRSRGYAPQPIKLPLHCPCPILAVGGQLKGTFALGRDDEAILSHHLGDLDHYDAYRAFEKDIDLYQQLFAIRPKYIAHDMHPDYASTRYALARTESSLSLESRRSDVPLVSIQHHHAHMASCMAEHRLPGPVIGVTFDGTGYGTDGAIWGGEFLVGDYDRFQRVAHLQYVGLPGGTQAIKEPWRMAAAYLVDVGCDSACLESRVSSIELRTVETMLQRRLNSPPTSSMGRLFDAVASLIGVRDRVSYEGQAAMELEWLAAEEEPRGNYPWKLIDRYEADTSRFASKQPFIIDTRPLIRAIVADVRHGVDRRIIARRFHSTIVEMIVEVCGRIRERTGVNTVVLSGGVFLNALLTIEAIARLTEKRFNVYRHRLVPPNDGGLSLGQLAVGAAVIGDEKSIASQSEPIELVGGRASECLKGTRDFDL